MNLLDLPVGPDPPRVLNAIVEIPRGGRSKFEYDAATGVFRLDRVLYSAVHYPGAYGFVPGTRAGDGDAADILVMTVAETFPGSLIEVRPVGLLNMRDDKGSDEKLLAVATADPNYEQVRDLGDVPPHFLKEVEHFFRIYKDLEGKLVETFGWGDRAVAETYVLTSIVA